jgi:hypothetical protein
MAIEEIPTAFRYICDSCGKIHLQENAAGHYTNSCPPHWGMLTLAQVAYDFQGAACADATIKRLLCPECKDQTVEAINEAAAILRRPP